VHAFIVSRARSVAIVILASDFPHSRSLTMRNLIRARLSEDTGRLSTARGKPEAEAR
jgi:hypothetical protein